MEGRMEGCMEGRMEGSRPCGHPKAQWFENVKAWMGVDAPRSLNTEKDEKTGANGSMEGN